MMEFEHEIVKFAYELIKSNFEILKSKRIVIREYPRISVESDKYREFIFVLWNEVTKKILVTEFPTFIDCKAFCTIDQAKEWILEDFEDFLKK